MTKPTIYVLTDDKPNIPVELNRELNNLQVTLLNVGYTFRIAAAITDGIRAARIRRLAAPVDPALPIAPYNEAEDMRATRILALSALALLAAKPTAATAVIEAIDNDSPIPVPATVDPENPAPIPVFHPRKTNHATIRPDEEYYRHGRRPPSEADKARILAAEAKRARKAERLKAQLAKTKAVAAIHDTVVPHV